VTFYISALELEILLLTYLLTYLPQIGTLPRLVFWFHRAATESMQQLTHYALVSRVVLAYNENISVLSEKSNITSTSRYTLCQL